MEDGVWVFRSGKKPSAADADKVLRDIRQQRDRRIVNERLDPEIAERVKSP